jgi:CheY-like chemotaxis protein
MAEQPPEQPVGALVLVLDNDPAVLQGMEALLRGWSCRVACAASGDEALEQLAALPRRPDLLIADYHLDDGALGLAEVERLRTACGHPLPAVIVTADRTPELALAAKAADCLLLNKPVKPAQLRAVVRSVV